MDNFYYYYCYDNGLLGGGVTPETNQRLHLASISYEWSLLVDNNKNSINNGLNGADPLINEGRGIDR